MARRDHKDREDREREGKVIQVVCSVEVLNNLSATSYNREREVKQMSEDFKSIDVLTESLIVQMIHTLREKDFDIASTHFIRDVAFLNECVKSMLYREYGYEHPMTDLISKLFEIKKQGDKFLTKFAADRLAKVIKDL